jgi:hypothetical protein
MSRRGDCRPSLQYRQGDHQVEKDDQSNPVSEGSFGEVGDGVSLALSGEFISVDWDNQEVLDVFPDGFAIRPPEWSDCVQENREGIHTQLPDLLVLVLVTFL